MLTYNRIEKFTWQSCMCCNPAKRNFWMVALQNPAMKLILDSWIEKKFVLSVVEKLIKEKVVQLVSKNYQNRKPLVWVVSNCKTQSKREDLVKKISSHFKVDIYGDCGSLRCSKESDSECMKIMEKNYKFYLRWKWFSDIKWIDLLV